jgi:glycerophosphoryl diester phosphodiesterase
MSRGPKLAAHRGGAALWPENSLLAFRRALALGSDLLELDVHPTADGEVAVIHDPTLDRTTDATGPVAARTAAELAQVRLKGPDGALTGERVPLLDAALALVAPSPAALLVEMKGPEPGFGVRWRGEAGGARPEPGPRYAGLEEAVLARLARSGLGDRAIVMAFNPDVIARVRALAPRQRVTLLVGAYHVAETGVRPEETVEWAVRCGATDLGLQHTLLSPEVVGAARAAGVVLGVWTVNDEAAMRRAVELGVDLITSDRPDLLKRVLGRSP